MRRSFRPGPGGPDLDGQALRRGRRQGDVGFGNKAGGLDPGEDLVVGEAETTVLVGLAQELVVVRGEVGDQQQAGRRHQARGLGHGGGGIAQIVQHLVDRHEVGAAARQAGVEDIAVAQLAGRQPGLCHLVAGDVQHLLGQVQPEGVERSAAKEGQHAPRARAQVDHLVERTLAGGAQDGGLDLVFVDIERTDLVPAGGVAGEIGLGAGRALRPHRGQLAGVALHDGVVGPDQRESRGHHRPAAGGAA
jgi:hypothetical protein